MKWLNVVDFYANQNLIRFFCNSLITKHSHEDTEIKAKNGVLKQAKMVTIYQKNNTTDTKKRLVTNNSIDYEGCQKSGTSGGRSFE